MASGMTEKWKVRVYEDGKHMHISSYTHSDLYVLATAALEVLERKDITLRVDTDGADILLEYPETLPPSFVGALIRIFPNDSREKRWSRYIQIHFINPTLYSKYYQRPLDQILIV